MQVWRRPIFGEAGPLGGDSPLVTPEGYFMLDVIFTTPTVTEEIAATIIFIDVVDAIAAARVRRQNWGKQRGSTHLDGKLSLIHDIAYLINSIIIYYYNNRIIWILYYLILRVKNTCNYMDLDKIVTIDYLFKLIKNL